MDRSIAAILLCAFSLAAACREAPDTTPSWIKQSNEYTNKLLSVELEHTPEEGTRQGVAKFDQLISNPTLADDLAQRHELEAVLETIKAAQKTEKNRYVLEDLEILRKAFELQFREQDYELLHEVPFLNASETVFQGLRGLLDDQVAAERRPAAVVRLRKYAGIEAGYTPYTELLKRRALEQMAKPGVIYPSKEEVETELGRDSNYVDGIADLFKKYRQSGWDDSYAKLKTELTGYDAWVRANILPKARTDFRLPPEKYALAFESYGIGIPPARIAAMAHAAFAE